MKYVELRKLVDRLYFSSSDVSILLGIKSSSALVLCSRYVERGLFIRLKRDLYTLRERWQKNKTEDYFRISNILQVPSYISLMTALSFYEVSTQVNRGYYEAVCIKRTASYNIEDIEFHFYKLNRGLYFDFIREGDLFIATKEKAFLDAVYLYSFGKYTFDIDSIDIKRLDIQRIKKLIKSFPERTQKEAKRICRI